MSKDNSKKYWIDGVNCDDEIIVVSTEEPEFCPVCSTPASVGEDEDE